MAKEQNKIVIAGHTHRPVFENLSLTERRYLETGIATRGIRRKDKAEPVYYNSGSCVHPRCVTGIEITLEPLHFTLVKWGYQAGAEPAAKGTGSFPTTRSLAIARTVLEESKK